MKDSTEQLERDLLMDQIQQNQNLNNRVKQMNTQSLSAFNRISAEMDHLSSLINKEQILHQELQAAMKNNFQSDSSSSVTENLDLYLKQYDNPTTKSIPFDSQYQINEQESESISAIQRNRTIEDKQQMRRQATSDKATVALGNIKSGRIQQQIVNETAKTLNCHFSSLNSNNRNIIKKQISITKSKQNSTKNATSSMPSEVSASLQQYKHNNPVNLKNCSFAKAAMRVQSPNSNLQKIHKKGLCQSENNLNTLKKELNQKFAKIDKIDKNELNRLQQKKSHKKTEQSSKRTKTKRLSNNPKSTAKLNQPKFSQDKSKFAVKTYNNVSCKILSNKKIDSDVKKNKQKVLSNDKSWLRTMDKGNKKLNKINLCKLQQNMKKAQNKKQTPKDFIKDNVKSRYPEYSSQKQQLKLHFTSQNQLSQMKKLIDQKQLREEYSRETDKYLNLTNKMSTSYFGILIRQCRQTSEEAIFKIKLATLLLYFFDQFSPTSLISISKSIDNTTDRFFINLAEQQLIQVLLHPKKIHSLMLQLPNMLMSNNTIAAERKRMFDRKFAEINDLLDQQLQFFLIKKTTLYMYIYTLWEYIQFLLDNKLIEQTKRLKLVQIQPEHQMKGFYSSRRKTGQNIKKYIKKNQSSFKFGFRCDSDRKITIEDEDFQILVAKRKLHNGPVIAVKCKKQVKTKCK